MTPPTPNPAAPVGSPPTAPHPLPQGLAGAAAPLKPYDCLYSCGGRDRDGQHFTWRCLAGKHGHGGDHQFAFVEATGQPFYDTPSDANAAAPWPRFVVKREVTETRVRVTFSCAACTDAGLVDDGSGLCRDCWRCAILAPAAARGAP